MKKLQILGGGCPNCKELAERTKLAAESLNLEFEIEKISDIQDIIDFGVMSTPALAVDGEIKSSGKIPSVKEIKDLIK